MKIKGKLVRWVENKGFGFIKSETVDKDIFIHISTLKHMSRKPLVGDVILFDVVTDVDGKQRAENASIEGVSVKQKGKRHKKSSSKAGDNIFYTVVFILVVAFVFYLYQLNSPSPKILNDIFSKEDFSGFSCQGKQHCSQMISCKEARFYLKNCPNVEIDGDRDGVPCEIQWCR